MTNASKISGVLFWILFCIPFCCAGVFSAVMLVKNLMAGNWKEAGFFALFALVFGGTGFGFLGAAIVDNRRVAREASLKDTHPDEPWLWKKSWGGGVIKSTSRGQMIGAWIFAILWNAISCPVLFALPGELESGNKEILFALVFPLVGLGLITWAVRATLAYRKYGVSRFQLKPFPGVIGGKVGGVVHTNINIRPEKGFRVKLSNIARIVTGSGKNRSTREQILWEDEQTMRGELLESDFSRSAIPVLFYAPFDAEPSNYDKPNHVKVWRLQVSAEVTGTDYNALFEIPVFRTQDSSPNVVEDYSAIAAYREESLGDEGRMSSKIERRAGPHGGEEFYFPPARNPMNIVLLLLFTLIWTGAVVFMIQHEAPLPFPIIFGAVDLFLVWGVFSMLFASTSVEVSSDRVYFTTSFLGLSRTREVPASEIKEFHTRRGTQAGSKVFYNIEATTSGGKSISAGDTIPTKQEAEWLAEEMNRVLNKT